MIELLLIFLLAIPVTYGFIRYPEVLIGITIMTKPELVNLLVPIVGDLPIKALLVNSYVLLVVCGFFIWKKRTGVILNPVFMVSLALGIWLFYGTTYSSRFTDAINLTQLYFFENLYMAFIASIFFKEAHRFQRFTLFLMLAGWLLLAFALLLPSTRFLHVARLNPGNYAPIEFGRLVALSVLASYGIFLYGHSQRSMRILSALFVPVGIGLIFFTGSKGPLIGLFAGLVLISIIYSFQSSFLKVSATSLVTFVFILVGAGLALYYMPENVLDRLLIRNDDIYDGSVLNRRVQLERSWDMFLEQPFIGMGTGSFEFGDIQYPHNIFAEFASENGIIGLLLFCTLLYIALFRFPWHILLSSNEETSTDMQQLVIAISLFTIFFISSLFSGDVPANNTIWFFLSALYVLRVTQSHVEQLDSSSAEQPIYQENNQVGSIHRNPNVELI